MYFCSHHTASVEHNSLTHSLTGSGGVLCAERHDPLHHPPLLWFPGRSLILLDPPVRTQTGLEARPEGTHAGGHFINRLASPDGTTIGSLRSPSRLHRATIPHPPHPCPPFLGVSSILLLLSG